MIISEMWAPIRVLVRFVQLFAKSKEDCGEFMVRALVAPLQDEKLAKVINDFVVCFILFVVYVLFQCFLFVFISGSKWWKVVFM
jgi:hypothetical protein